MRSVYTRFDGVKNQSLTGTATKSAGFEDSESAEYRAYIFWPDCEPTVAYYAHETRVELMEPQKESHE